MPRKLKVFAVILIPAVAGLVLLARAGEASGDSACSASPATYAANGFEVNVSIFHPASRPGALVVLLGPTGGTTRLEVSYAEALCRAGLSSVVVDRWTDDQEYSLDLEIHERIYQRAQRAIDLVLKHFPDARVGALGTSLGATHAAIASLRSGRIRSVFLIVGGAPIASILASSKQPVLADGKEKRFKRYGFRSEAEYEQALREVISMEPLAMKPAGTLPRVGMAIANADEIVPTRFQNRLREAWRPVMVLESGFGHLGAILETWFCHRGKIVDFFASGLLESTGRH